MANRADHRRSTLLALSNAAVDLFERSGPGVTVDAIAAEAGVSRRTAFRYVESKEELAFLHPVIWFDVFNGALEQAAPDASLRQRLWLASAAIAAHVDADPEPPRRAFLVAAVHPELHRGFSAVFGRWVDRIADEVTHNAANDDPFQARIVGSAVMGMVDAVTRQWLVSSPGVTYANVCAQGFDVLSPLFDDEPGT